MRTLFLSLLASAILAVPASAATVDRIAAVVDRQVLTVSEVSQMVEIRFFPRGGTNEDDHRREVLEALIAQTLRFRDVERFGAQDISRDAIETRLKQIEGRFASPAEFDAAVVRSELTLDEVGALIKRQIQVEAYIRERFAPMIFVSNEEIAKAYAGPWAAQRRERGLPVPPLADVREEIRNDLRSSRLTEKTSSWTTGLRARANVDVYAWR